jgi:hypothetical protein
MPDEMPLQAPRESRDLDQSLLNTILAEEFLPGFHGFADDISWVSLGDGNQLNSRQLTAGTMRRVGDIRTDGF